MMKRKPSKWLAERAGERRGKILANYLASTVGAVLYAHIWAFFERFLEFGGIHRALNSLPEYTMYIRGYYYLAVAFAFIISFLPFLDDLIYEPTAPLFESRLWRKYSAVIIANILLIGLVEDMAYFYLFPPHFARPENWVCHIVGYIWVAPHYCVPLWYFIDPPIIIALYAYAIWRGHL